MTAIDHKCRVAGCNNRVPVGHTACDECKLPQAPHTCPFNEEIRDDYTTLCTCSKNEEYECLLDI